MTPKITRLFLARHGNTFNAGETAVMVGSQTDLSLTSFGHEQAQKLSHYFKAHHITFDKVYSGSLARQQQTASAISDNVIMNIKALNEIDYGLWEGLSNEEIILKWPEAFEGWSEHGIWPASVFRDDLESRKNLLEKWIESLGLDNETILAVSSGGTIRLILLLIPELAKDIDFKAYKMNTGYFCELLITEKGLEVIRWNQAP